MGFGMYAVDWAQVIGLIVLLVAVLIYCQKFVKSSADFIAANRCAGRYLLCITSGIAGIGAISIIANFEQIYASGFANTWWRFISGPMGLIISITGWVYYRLRETRCLTLSQFIEVRYSKNLRIFSGIMGWVSGILNYGIFPAVSVKFFIIFCRLPETFRIPGINYDFGTFAILLAVCCAMGATFAICGGQIAIMMTDFIQGVFCNVAFLVLLVYLLGHISWGHIFTALETDAVANPGTSLFNPFDTTKIKDFNIWFFLIGLVLTITNQGTWQGSSGYNVAAKNAHEAKMSRFLGTWRELIQASLMIFIPICAFTFFHHPEFAEKAKVVNDMISTYGGQDAVQARVPLFLNYALPTGLVGLFAAVMFAAMLSTDDTYMHSWGTIFIQDVIMPFRKKAFTAKQHLVALRWSIIFVAVFAYLFSYFFKQTEYIILFMQITGAIFMGGAGAVLIGGLYSKVGTALGGWISMILGSSLSVLCIILQQVWTSLAPWLQAHSPQGIADWLGNNLERFPLNGQQVSLIVSIIGFGSYFIISWLDRKIHHLPEFNMNKMLHRGEYDTHQEHKEVWKANRFWKALGLTNEFTFGDRLWFFASIGWTLVWCGCFIVLTIGHFTHGWTALNWLQFWKTYVMIGFWLGTAATIWFLAFGIRDVIVMFKTLKTAKRDFSDNGSVSENL